MSHASLDPDVLAIHRSFASRSPREIGSRFAQVARALFDRHELHFGDARFRLLDVEFYVHAAGHEDPYTHRNPKQSTFGQWYFHRVGPSLRNGTFKGLDLTLCVDDSAPSEDARAVYAAVLLRGAQSLDGATVLDGPCVLVDHAIRSAGLRTIAELCDAVEGPVVTDARARAPIALVPSEASAPATLYATPRVGLALSDERARFCAARYRFLADGQAIKKGRAELLCALFADGARESAVVARTRSPLSTVRACADAYDRGRAGRPRPTTLRASAARCYELGLAEHRARYHVSPR